MMVNTEVSSQLEKDFSKVIKIDSSEIHAHIDSMVRETVEETLNKMLEAEADRLCKAERYEHRDERSDTRAGHYSRKLHVKAGVVNLKVPRLRKTTFETAIIERYRRREASVEEALIEMYVAGVSVRRVEDMITYTFVRTILSGHKRSPLIWSIGYCQSNHMTRERANDGEHRSIVAT